MHVSEKHLFEHDPKQIAQFGGGLAEDEVFSNLLSAMLTNIHSNTL